MELYERLLYLNESPAAIANGFAEYLAFDDEADRANGIPGALRTTIRARNQFIAAREPIEQEPGNDTSPFEDFAEVVIPGCSPAGAPTAAQLAAWEAHKARCRDEHEESRRAHEARIKALDTLFKALCRAFRVWGLSITPGQLSALKRENIPDHLCKELERLKRPKQSAIPPEERLDAASAGAIYAALTREGLLSGPYETFAFYLGECTTGNKKSPETGLKWLGRLSGLAYFARCFSQYTQPGSFGYITREKALCRAFGIDERTRENTIHPYIAARKEPRIKAQIDAAFKDAAEAREKGLSDAGTNN